MRLQLEIAVAKTAGRLSRLAGKGGGTTLPGKLLTRVDAGAVTRLAARLPLGSALISATNGKTTTSTMTAEILAPRVRLAHNRAGANLMSGVASVLMDSRGAELALLEVDEAALPEIARQVQPRAICLGNLFRDQLDRYGELELIAERWRAAVAALATDAWMVVNADDPVLAALAGTRDHVIRFGLDDRRVARDQVPHAADSTYCVSCGAPYLYEASYVGHLGEYRCAECGASRPPLDVVARNIELAGLERTTFDLVTREGTRRVAIELPGLYNVYNAVAAASLSLALGASLDEIASGLARSRPAFGRFERIAIDDRTILVLLIKNPAGANEAIRTLVSGDPPSVALIALNDEIADGRDVSWIWDVDFEPLLAGLDRLVASGARAEELALRFKYGGLEEGRIEVVPEIDRALDRGLELTPPDGELVVLPTYTAMLALQGLVARRGLVRPYWEDDRPLRARVALAV